MVVVNVELMLEVVIDSVLVLWLLMVICNCGVLLRLVVCMLVSSVLLCVSCRNWFCVFNSVLWFMLFIFFNFRLKFEFCFRLCIVGGFIRNMCVLWILDKFVLVRCISLDVDCLVLVCWFYFFKWMKVCVLFWLLLFMLVLMMVSIELIDLGLFMKYFCMVFMMVVVCLVVVFVGSWIWVISMFWFFFGRKEVGRCMNSIVIVMVIKVYISRLCLLCLSRLLILFW